MCPADYVLVHGTSQYRLATTGQGFFPAVKDCADDETTGPPISGHTHLAVLSDLAELHFLYSQGADRGIGLSDLKTTGIWHWVTNEPALDTAATDTMLWAPTEPNMPGVEDCGRFDSGHADRVTNAICSEAHVYTCECDAYPNDPSTY